MVLAGFGVAQEEFEIALVVLRGLLDGQAVFGGIRHAEAEAVSLDEAVARTLRSRTLRVDAGQQPARRVSGSDIG